MSQRIAIEPLPRSEQLPRRRPEEIEAVVLHCTELPSLGQARAVARFTQDDGQPTLVAAHYYIDRDGSIHRFIDDERVASHAAGENARSVGIELVNRGRWPDHFAVGAQEMTEPYSPEQIAALRWLLADLRERLPGLRRLVRHSDVDTRLVPASDDPSREVRRRLDPGPLFPWEEVAQFWRQLGGEAS